MRTRLTVIAIASFAILGTGLTTAHADGLTGGERDEFVNGAIPSCTAQNRNNPANRDYSDDDIRQYCTCYANELADITTHEDVQNLIATQNTGIGWFLPKTNQANAYCAQNW